MGMEPLSLSGFCRPGLITAISTETYRPTVPTRLVYLGGTGSDRLSVEQVYIGEWPCWSGTVTSVPVEALREGSIVDVPDADLAVAIDMLQGSGLMRHVAHPTLRRLLGRQPTPKEIATWLTGNLGEPRWLMAGQRLTINVYNSGSDETWFSSIVWSRPGSPPQPARGRRTVTSFDE